MRVTVAKTIHHHHHHHHHNTKRGVVKECIMMISLFLGTQSLCALINQRGMSTALQEHPSGCGDFGPWRVGQQFESLGNRYIQVSLMS